MLNVEGERSRSSREFSRPRFKRVSNDLLEARRLVRGWGGRQRARDLARDRQGAIGTIKRQSSRNPPSVCGEERVTEFWEARVTSTCPQFVSRAKLEWEIFYVFCSLRSMAVLVARAK